MRQLILYFAVVVVMGVALAAHTRAPDTVRERHSHIAFPVQLTPPGAATPHELAGTAVRTKTIFRITIYAFGLYVDADGARSRLSAYSGVRAARLERDESFYRQLLDLNLALTLRIVMTRDVEGNDVADSFDEVLKSRVVRAARERAMPGGEAALQQFRRYLNREKVTTGTEIVFSCSPDGRLETSVGGTLKPALQSHALCWALFDVYLGEKPVSSDAKRRMIARFPDVLTTRSVE